MWVLLRVEIKIEMGVKNSWIRAHIPTILRNWGKKSLFFKNFCSDCLILRCEGNKHGFGSLEDRSVKFPNPIYPITLYNLLYILNIYIYRYR